MDIYENKQMEGLAPIDQAKKAISHTLRAIQDDERKWDVMGLGTQSYALLTEAAATMFNEPVADVRRNFCPVQKRGGR